MTKPTLNRKGITSVDNLRACVRDGVAHYELWDTTKRAFTLVKVVGLAFLASPKRNVSCGRYVCTAQLENGDNVPLYRNVFQTAQLVVI